jgi:uncharacterized protein (TIGR00369 family)
MNPAELSGLELLRAAAAGAVPRASIGETMGFGSMDVEEGRVIMRTTADARHLNPMGGVHGGYAATVLDTVTGCAVHTMLPAGTSYGTVDLAVKMMRPVPRDVELIAEARVTHVSGSIGISEGTLRGPDGTLLASATCTCFIKRPRSA